MGAVGGGKAEGLPGREWTSPSGFARAPSPPSSASRSPRAWAAATRARPRTSRACASRCAASVPGSTASPRARRPRLPGAPSREAVDARGDDDRARSGPRPRELEVERGGRGGGKRGRAKGEFGGRQNPPPSAVIARRRFVWRCSLGAPRIVVVVARQAADHFADRGSRPSQKSGFIVERAPRVRVGHFAPRVRSGFRHRTRAHDPALAMEEDHGDALASRSSQCVPVSRARDRDVLSFWAPAAGFDSSRTCPDSLHASHRRVPARRRDRAS